MRNEMVRLLAELHRERIPGWGIACDEDIEFALWMERAARRHDWDQEARALADAELRVLKWRTFLAHRRAQEARCRYCGIAGDDIQHHLDAHGLDTGDWMHRECFIHGDPARESELVRRVGERQKRESCYFVG